MTCDIDALLRAACENKFLCLSLQEQQAVLLQMLCNGVGGGTSGSGAPTIAPSGTFGVYYDYTNNNIYGWNPVSNTWVLIGVGGGAAVPDYYAFPGPPVGTPAANNLQNIIVDVNGQQWMYWGGQWN